MKNTNEEVTGERLVNKVKKIRKSNLKENFLVGIMHSMYFVATDELGVKILGLVEKKSFEEGTRRNYA